VQPPLPATWMRVGSRAASTPPPSGGRQAAGSQQRPLAQLSPPGQRTPMQGSDTHAPLVGSHARPAGHSTATQRGWSHSAVTQSTLVQGGSQAPSRHCSPGAHATCWQRSVTHTPSRHSCPAVQRAGKL